MSEKIATLIKVHEEGLRKEILESLHADQLLAVLSDNPHNAEEFITITDDADYEILANELVILTGKTNRSDFFAQVSTQRTEISRAVKRGYFHWETMNMNRAAYRSVQKHKENLDAIVTELSQAINNKELIREIKESLPDFLPVGVAVVDSDGKVIYGNREFYKFFNGSDVKPLGKAYANIFPDSVVQLIEQTTENRCLATINGIEVSVRRAPLKSASTKQGLVLVITEV